MRLTATLVGHRLDDAVPLLAPMVTNPALPADAVEAVLGAAFLDGHLEVVRRIILTEFSELIEKASGRERGRNQKT